MKCIKCHQDIPRPKNTPPHVKQAFDIVRSWRPEIADGEPAPKDALLKRANELRTLLMRLWLPTETLSDAANLDKLPGIDEIFQNTDVNGQDVRLVGALLTALIRFADLHEAISVGDMDEVIALTYAFALADSEVRTIQRCGWFTADAFELWEKETKNAIELRKKQAEGPQKNKLLKEDHEIRLLRILLEKYRGQPNRFAKMADEIYDRHGLRNLKGGKISADTIERRCKEYGFLGSSTAAP